MDYILAIDTTTDPGSLALTRDGELLEEVVLKAPDGYGDVLFVEMETLLARHSVALRDIRRFAAASGPGTFTGVRAGLTTVKGFAEITGGQAIGVSNLQAVAWFGTSDLRAPNVNAHRGEIYGGVYDAELRLVQDEVVMKYDAWVLRLPAGAVPMVQEHPLARAIAAIVWEGRPVSAPADPAELDANYVRRADAELMWKDA